MSSSNSSSSSSSSSCSTTEQKCVCSCNCCVKNKERFDEILDRLKYLTSAAERTEAMVGVLYEEGVDEEDDDGEDVRESVSEDERDLKRPDTPPTKEDRDFIDDTPIDTSSQKKQKLQRSKKRKIIDDDDNEY